jgi:hypothetical protein
MSAIDHNAIPASERVNMVADRIRNQKWPLI